MQDSTVGVDRGRGRDLGLCEITVWTLNAEVVDGKALIEGGRGAGAGAGAVEKGTETCGVDVRMSILADPDRDPEVIGEIVDHRTLALHLAPHLVLGRIELCPLSSLDK